MSLLRTVARRLWAAYTGFQEHEGVLSASAIAYTVAVSLFPLLMVLVAILGAVVQWTSGEQDPQQQLVATLEKMVSPELATQVARVVHVASERAGTGGPIGFCVLVVSAIVIFSQLDAAMDRIFKLPAPPHEGWLGWIRRLIFQRLKALGMLAGAGGFIILAMIASTTFSSIQQAMQPAAPFGPWIEWATSLWLNLILNAAAFTLLYRVVPKPYIPWRDALHGGIVAAALWEGGRQALTAYFARLNYPSAYGIIGSFLIVMLWAYYGSMVILFGAEYVRASRDDAAGVS